MLTKYLSERFFKFKYKFNENLVKSATGAFLNEINKNYSHIWSDESVIDYDLNIVKKNKWLTCGDTESNFKKKRHAFYNENSIEYLYNKNNFRLYKNQKHTSKKIACFGCSITFGVGLPDEDTWAYRVNETLGFSNYTCYNFGINGGSNDAICRLIYNLLSHNKPDAVLCHFPDIFRIEQYGSTSSPVLSFHPHLQDSDFFDRFSSADDGDAYRKLSRKELDAYSTHVNEFAAFFNFVKNFKFIEALCKLHNIPFIWCSWSPIMLVFTSDIINKYFNNDFLKNEDGKMLYALKEYNCVDDIARDNEHTGPKYNARLGQKFAEELLKKL